ncbi:MAG: UvrD-helicase domain-containing protein [Bryobacteraceae bacterium]|nr:UvrD-helicase domain-containing protein [Bryobacteraceae bacterium]
MNLTPEQFAAVTRWGQDVCVIAGPGSGKTRVLVERYAWLIHERGYRPSQVLAITFTEKAAQEIKQRLAVRFRDQPALRQEIERAPVATIHGFGARLLRRYAIPAGLDPRFTILDEAEMRAELHTAIKATLDRMAAERRSDLRLLLSAWHSDQPVEHLAELYETWRSSGGRLEHLRTEPESQPDRSHLLAATADLDKPGFREWLDLLRRMPESLTAKHFALLDQGANLIKNARGDAAKHFRECLKEYRLAALMHHYAPARELLVELFAQLASDVDRRKFERGVLDFGDLESRTIALLEGYPEIRSRVQEEYEAILMDELQDTNPLQWRLMNLVRREGRFFGVGDLNQSIFGFRHATPESFRQYRQGLLDSLQAVDELRGNYRSRPEILQTAMAIVDDAPGLEPPLLEARREFPPSDGPVVEALVTEGDTPELREQLEAEHVARRIRELHATGYRYSHFALLFRQTTGLPVFEQALRAFGVPFVMSLGRGFFAAPEVTDLVNWLRMVANPRDEIALVAVLRSPLAGYSDEDIYAMRLAGGALVDALPADFAARLHLHREMAQEIAPDRLLACAVDESGYALGLDAAGRANIDKLLTMVREWWHADPRPLAELVRRLEERAQEREGNAPTGDDGEAVQVMTMHGAKGLEFPVVFLCGLQRAGGGGRSAPVSFHPSRGLGITWRDPATGDAVHDRLHRQNLDAEIEREAAEVNRLFYVGMTRAEDRLCFSWAEGKQVRSKWPEMVRRCVTPRLAIVPPPRYDLVEFTATARPPELLRPIAPDEPWDAVLTVTSVPAPGFEDTTLGQRARRATEQHRDWDFTVEINGVIVTGAIDVWFVEHGEPIVVAFATDVWPASLYAFVLARHLGRAARAFRFDGEVTEVEVRDPAFYVESWKQTI